MRFHSYMAALILLAVTLCSAPNLTAQITMGTGFTYQGSLKDGGAPVTGNHAMTFKVYDQASGVNPALGTLSFPAVTVTGGLFNVLLDFGAGVFTGQARWLGITVDAGAELAPRVPLTPAPYALFAVAADTARDANTVDGLNPGNASGNIAVNNGTLNTNLNADMLDGLNSGNASGNVPVSNGTVNTNLNADMLDGLHASSFITGSHNHDSAYVNTTGDTMSGALNMNGSQITGIGSGFSNFTAAGALNLNGLLQILSGGATISGNTGITGTLNVTASAGNASAVLPNSSISMAECFDEPGFNSTSWGAFTNLPGLPTYTNLAGLSMTTPADGNIVVIAVGTLRQTATFQVGRFRITINGTATGTINSVGGINQGFVDIPFTILGSTFVTAGTHNISVQGAQNGGAGTAQATDIQIISFFMPTTY